MQWCRPHNRFHPDAEPCPRCAARALREADRAIAPADPARRRRERCHSCWHLLTVCACGLSSQLASRPYPGVLRTPIDGGRAAYLSREDIERTIERMRRQARDEWDRRSGGP